MGSKLIRYKNEALDLATLNEMAVHHDCINSKFMQSYPPNACWSGMRKALN